MKRFCSDMMDHNMDEPNEYQMAMKKVNLVERNEAPNGLQLVNKYTVGNHQETDIIALAQQIQSADIALRNNATGKLSIILEQIKFLQSQAQKILEENQFNKVLHNAACNFQKISGKTYHLYERESGQRFIGMLSPQEWGTNCVHKFLGSFRLEADQSWTPIERVEEVTQTNAWANQILNAASNKSSNSSFLAINLDNNDMN